MQTVDVLATVKWNTLTYMYKSSLIKLFFKGYNGMLPSTLAEELIVHGDRPSSRLKHGLKAPSFTSKYVQNSISCRAVGCPLERYRAIQERLFSSSLGRSDRSILECTDLKSFLKNVVNCHTFNDFNFNILAPQIINFVRFYQNFLFCKNYF